MTEINELTWIRRANCLQIMSENEWTRKDFAEHSKIKYATASGVLGDNPKQNFGQRMADTIETNLTFLTKGWLDKDRRGAEKKPLESNWITGAIDGFAFDKKSLKPFQAREIMRIMLDD